MSPANPRRVSRDEVLDAVRRCAAANGGRPLGRKRFQEATGIREADWLGVYWARWSDVLADAGYEPNVMQQRTHDPDWLLRQLADLTVELGHFPTMPELRLRRRADPDFPSWNSFGSHLGSRGQILERLVQLGEREGLEPLLTICRPLIVPEAPEATTATDQVAGSVYLLKSGRHYKIGRSNHVGRRHYEVGLQLPEAVTVVHEIATDDPEGIERYWHERFAAKRMNGEWFRLSAADVAAFKRRRHFM